MVLRNDRTRAYCLSFELVSQFESLKSDSIELDFSHILSGVHVSDYVRVKDIWGSWRVLKLYNMLAISIFSKMRVYYITVFADALFSRHVLSNV